MYKVERVFVTQGKIIRNLDVTSEKVRNLLPLYTSIKVILSSPDLEVEVEGELHDNVFIASFEGTIADLILTNQITNLNLVTHDETALRKCVFKTDLWERDYDVKPFNLFDVGSSDDELTYPDLLIVNGFIDTTRLAENYLISVNGLIHPLVSDSTGIYIVGGNVNIRENDALEMSLIEFRDVGGITYHGLSCADRVKVHQDVDLFGNGIYTRIPNDAKDKVIGLVLLGHLHLLDGAYTHFDDDILHIDLKHLDIETKIINHHRALGMEKVSDYVGGNLGQVDMRNPTLIDFIINNKSTFLFTLDTPELYRSDRQLFDEGLPCLYSTTVGVQGILQYPDGLLADYRQEYQDGVYAIQVPTRPRTNILMKTTDYARQQAGVIGALPRPNASQIPLSAVDFFVKE